ncbi:allophanate hydrolase [Kineococcus sp. SYSU DK006]|uniref:allophanate hydrolase n=1 Tax=Kineococcus sp. SYSU DK006 TaxID=3383127 RepID=UPI003D7D8EC5
MRAAYRRLAQTAADGSARPEAWITLRPEQDALADAAAVDRRLAAGEELPLAGTVVAVKNNIDVAGIATTCAAPSLQRIPSESAVAVQRLIDAGAVVLGTTNMDQFATGLVGTRSPYGAVRSVPDATRVSGGSSSGSAVVVALGIVDAALGTDTAGSGRVPAALNGIVGLKPSLGLVPLTGVVPAAPSFDTISVFAADLATAERFTAVIAGPAPTDPSVRTWTAEAPLAAPQRPRIGVPAAPLLTPLSPARAAAFAEAVQRARAVAEVVEVDLEALLEAGAMLYGAGLVAERAAGFGSQAERAPELDPSVASVLADARSVSGADYVRARQHLAQLLQRARQAMRGVDLIMLPTVTQAPTLAEVQADPLGVNARMGRFSTFANLADMCALAVPFGQADGLPCSITLAAAAMHDALIVDVAHRLLQDQRPEQPWTPPGVDLVVFGAHRQGQPLNHQISQRGGRLIGPVRTAPVYQMFALPTVPPKPAVVRSTSTTGGTAGSATEAITGSATEGTTGSITGERWRLPRAAVADFLADLAAPMSIGRVQLEDGSSELGFLAEACSVQQAQDITELGDWLTHVNP